MVKIKNIRIKMKGGKSRLQRVRVLASGKYRFVKNLTRSTSRKTSSSKTKTKRRSVKRMGRRKKKRGGGGKSATRGIFKLLRIGALLAPAAYVVMTHKDTASRIDGIALRYTGFSTRSGGWHPQYLKEGWGPVIVTSALTHLVPKINGFIRRLF